MVINFVLHKIMVTQLILAHKQLPIRNKADMRSGAFAITELIEVALELFSLARLLCVRAAGPASFIFVMLNVILSDMLAEHRLPIATLLFLTVCAIAAGQPPPIEAFGAVVEGYAQQRDAEAALAVLKTFFEQGGEADARMYDIVVDVCVRAHKFQRALQVRLL